MTMHVLTRIRNNTDIIKLSGGFLHHNVLRVEIEKVKCCRNGPRRFGEMSVVSTALSANIWLNGDSTNKVNKSGSCNKRLVI